ncbi:MAG TPA: hypothetical protein VJU15_11845 [Gemmatimonadales bacterium]|nr:hypothetical protein [Gemmatimonadales bacterium]
MRILIAITLATLLGCGGGSKPATSASPAPGPTHAVDDFMKAVADSNLTRMAQLWGTSKGSAAETGKPTDYQRRVAVIYTFLKGSTAKVLAEVERSDSKSTLAVEVTRSDCRKRIPITLEKTKDDRWLVSSIELGSLGTPGRACPPEEQRKPGA